MPNGKSQKVAIVGSGIIGLYLAWKLAEAGHKVTVFEKKREIETKVCSALVSERINSFFLLSKNLIENKINSCQIHFPKKTITLNFKPAHFAIDRLKGAKLLLNLAEKSGAKILFGQTVSEIPQSFDKVIGCDGALSSIRKILSLPQPHFRLGLQLFMPIRDDSDYVEAWAIKDGFFWKIPRGSQIEYGALGSLDSIKENFQEFCEKQNIKLNEKVLQSALIPLGLVLPKGKDITLCGDAAGLAKPWSGGGIIWGLTAANILIKNFPNFDAYHREIQRLFGSKILLGKLSSQLVYFTGENLSFFLPSKITYDNDYLRVKIFKQ